MWISQCNEGTANNRERGSNHCHRIHIENKNIHRKLTRNTCGEGVWSDPEKVDSQLSECLRRVAFVAGKKI